MAIVQTRAQVGRAAREAREGSAVPRKLPAKAQVIGTVTTESAKEATVI
jgi:hypothetical protein